jgi:hypothetical protein
VKRSVTPNASLAGDGAVDAAVESALVVASLGVEMGSDKTLHH